MVTVSVVPPSTGPPGMPHTTRKRTAVPSRAAEPEFTPDGAYLFAFTDDGLVYRWDVRADSWARHACAVAGRSLTRDEWRDALPERDYDPAC